MKISNKVSVGALAVSLTLGLVLPLTAFAATSPDLGAAASFSVIAQTGITGTATNIFGDVGLNSTYTGITALSTSMVSPGTIYSNPTGVLAGGGSTTLLPAAVQANLSTAYTFLNTGGDNASCIKASTGLTGTDTGVIELGGKSLPPGVYCTDGSYAITGASTLTLLGTTGTWIFKTATGLTTGVSSSVVGGDPCNVWWRVGSAAAGLGDASTFIGTIIAYTGITFGTNVTLNGRALAVGANVTLNSGGKISAPTCAAIRSSRANAPTITVVKSVINDNGGKKTVGDFSLFVADRLVGSGMANTFPFPASYVVSETPDSGYVGTFSGDCDSTGHISLAANEHKVCTITNNDVVPAIAITKTPSPLSLPFGPGPVTYTYAVTNTGKVALNTVGVKDDKCSPAQYVSGDTNRDGLLGLTETWIYDCFKTLSQTETNIATAHGRGLGMDVYATSTATVVVTPSVAPLAQIPATPLPVIPGFPNTGFAPHGSSFWNSILTVGALAVVAAAAIVFRKRRA